MSEQSRGFVREERFGPGERVIGGRNTATVRKWLDLGMPEPKGFAVPSTCTVCAIAICNCRECVKFKGDGRCQEHRSVPA